MVTVTDQVRYELKLFLLFNPTHALTYSIKTPVHTNI